MHLSEYIYLPTINLDTCNKNIGLNKKCSAIFVFTQTQFILHVLHVYFICQIFKLSAIKKWHENTFFIFTQWIISFT